MEIVLSKIEDVSKYDPYVDLFWERDSEYFEGKFLEYFESFSLEVSKLKDKFNHKKDKQIDKYFSKIIKKRNDKEIEYLLNRHYKMVNSYINDETRENYIKILKADIRRIKDIVLISEPSDMKRLGKIDDLVSKEIDNVSRMINDVDNINIYGMDISMDNFLGDFNPDNNMDLDSYGQYLELFIHRKEELCKRYRNNYSVDTAEKYINKINSRFDKFLDKYAKRIYYDKGIKLIEDLLDKYTKTKLALNHYDIWIYEFKRDINVLRDKFKKVYSEKMFDKIASVLDKKTGILIDDRAISYGYHKKHDVKLKRIFCLYKPEYMNIFDVMFYSGEEERNIARDKYYKMTEEEQNVFEMRIYEKYIRMFKSKIRELSNDIRRVYSKEYADKLIASINKRADEHIRKKAKWLGKPVPKNPWFIRKYLWADNENFATEKGVNFRKKINPFMRWLVGVAMKNKLVIEERAKLDSTKKYIFVPTHYFAEDIIGLYSSLGRQGYMVMGTTDQIENNFLMLAAITLGLIYVDREDNISRKECIKKQNRIIDMGSNIINYVGGSWENSENELQPLSFSGPYKTALEKGVEVVPVGLYYVKEDKKIYVRYGEPLDLSNLDEKSANEIIRDALASIHFKQITKHSHPIETIEIDGYGRTHNLPYEQHINHMENVADEYWGQYWSKPFAKEEIGLRPKKVVSEEDVYSFVDNLSRDNLIKLAKYLSVPMLHRYERDDRYNMVKYIDENYDRLKNKHTRKRVRRK